MSGATVPAATARPRWRWWRSTVLALAVAATLTALSALPLPLMAGFALLTDCTNRFGCTEADAECGPCPVVGRWVLALRDGQLLLLGVTAVLTVLAAVRPWRPAVRTAAWVVTGLAFVWTVTALALASRY